MAKAAKPGAVWLTSGFRGGGKTHTAVALAEYMVKGKFPMKGRVFLVTNIIFFCRRGGKLVEECPDGVYHISTMKELFPIVVDIIERYGRDSLILLVLDEAQNFIGGDSNLSNASVMMKELLGTIRKFCMMVWFLTPSSMSVGPAFRNFLNNREYPGNLTAKFRKDLSANEKIIKAYGYAKIRPEELILFQNFDMEHAVVLRITRTEWTRTKEEICEGEYCYDHEASATFYVGDGFDWKAFNRAVGGVSSIRILDTIKDFYARNVDAGGDSKIIDVPKEFKLGIIRRAISAGIDVKAASAIAGVPYSTARRWLKESESDVSVDQNRYRSGDGYGYVSRLI